MPRIVGIIKPFDMGGTFSIREMGDLQGLDGDEESGQEADQRIDRQKLSSSAEARQCSYLTSWNYTYGNNANSSLVIGSRDG